MRMLGQLLWWTVPLAVNAMINPILPGWNPDPSIARLEDDFFIATSTFDYFPGHPIYHAKASNLSDWKLIGHGLNRPSQLSLFGTPSDAGLWAPTLRHHDGTWYLASTARYAYTPEYRLFPRSFYVKTDDIFSNNWSDPIYTDSLGYDSDLFWDTNGDVYETWSGNNNAVDKIYGIWQNKIDLATGNSLTPAQLIFNGTLELNASSRPEGPHVYLINDTYYLMIAEGGTGVTHRATIQRGPSPSGPWENNPNNPLVFNGANTSLPVQNTGHADFVEAPDGQWWGVALGVRPQAQNTNHVQLGRETFMFPVTWEDGWPVFNNHTPISEHIEGVLSDNVHLEDYFNDFDDHTLDLSFYYERTPYKPFTSLTARPGYLRISGNSYNLSDRDNPALLLRKQTSYEEVFETELSFEPSTNLTEAGISIYYSELLHDDIGITNIGGQRNVLVRSIVQIKQSSFPLTLGNSTTANVNYYPLATPSDPVTLRIIGNSTSYTFGFAEGNNSSEFTYPVTIDSAQLTTPPVGGSNFKGTAFGMYSTGNGRPVLEPADFAYWKQTPSIFNVSSTSGNEIKRDAQSKRGAASSWSPRLFGLDLDTVNVI